MKHAFLCILFLAISFQVCLAARRSSRKKIENPQLGGIAGLFGAGLGGGAEVVNGIRRGVSTILVGEDYADIISDDLRTAKEEATRTIGANGKSRSRSPTTHRSTRHSERNQQRSPSRQSSSRSRRRSQSRSASRHRQRKDSDKERNTRRSERNRSHGHSRRQRDSLPSRRRSESRSASRHHHRRDSNQERDRHRHRDYDRSRTHRDDRRRR